MAKENSPRQIQGDEKLVMEQRMKELNAAYLVLKDRSTTEARVRTDPGREEEGARAPVGGVFR